MALVVTIIVLIILATITITIVVGENGLINRAQQAKSLQEDSLDKENLDMILLSYRIYKENETSKGTQNIQTLEQYLADQDEVDNVTIKGSNVIVTYKGQQYSVNPDTLAAGAYETQGLKGDDETKVEAALKKSTGTLAIVNYVPTANSTATITIPSANNGGQADQTFTQSSVGSQNRNWYVLSTDDDGVNLVSTVTAQSVTFNDSAGYDNCLYYLDKISKDLFTNEEQYGVTRDRVHALRLTDIKKAAEQQNAGVKVGERDWSWSEDFEAKNNYASDLGKEFTPINKYYPALYEADGSNAVNCNNDIYDEDPGSLITDDTGIKAKGQASTLKVNYTHMTYSDKRSDQMTNLSTFGSSLIGQQIFSTSNNYWLASRCVYADSGRADFSLRIVNNSGCLSNGSLCRSNGSAYGSGLPFRVIVSVPASHINVDSNGNITLK